MKKYLALILGMLFVLGFAASAFAIHAEIPSETQAVVAKGTTQLTLGGELRMRGWYMDNITGTRGAASVPGDTASQGWYDARVRLSIQADVSKNTTGFVQLESGSGATSDTWTWGRLNSKPTEYPLFLQAWILHKGSGLLGIPAGIKVGHMPLALGEKQFLDHTKFGDDAIVFFMDPTKELHIGLITTKFTEGSVASSSANDLNGYVALATYKLNKANTIGVNYTYVNVQTIDEFAFQNLGLHAAGKVSGLSYKAEVDFQFGDYDATTKFKGNGIFASLGYKVDPVNIRAEYARGSGDSDTTDTKIKEFQTTMGRDVHYAFLYEFTLAGAAEDQRVDTAGGGRTTQTSGTTTYRSAGIANTTYYRLGLDWSPVKDLTTSIDGLIIRATNLPANVSKKIGSEVDVRIAYKIDKNLVYSILAGYFDGGKYWEDRKGVTAAANKKVLGAVHALTLSF